MNDKQRIAKLTRILDMLRDELRYVGSNGYSRRGEWFLRRARRIERVLEAVQS